MTFYWWSHWFWITLLGNILLPIVFVHTYPSQDNIALEYNNNNGNKNERNIKSVTKLYQTTTTLIWATTLPPNHKETNLVAGAPIKLKNVPITKNQTEVEETSEDDAEWNEGQETDDHSGSEDFEFKRSAVDSQANSTQIGDSGEALASNKQQNENKPSSSNIQEATGEVQQHSIATLASKEHSNNATRQEKKLNDLSVNNNFTNFSASVTSSKNATSKQTPTVTAAKSSKPIGTSSSSSSSASASASTPSKPQIENNDGGGGTHSTIEWLAQVPPLEDLTVDESQDVIGQKVPFTLENVNKEEEIIRAENEHRSRKSKVLSAEYKHINRFINYSADSKSLLTRSAATAPVDYDSEGNISSEALAIRRTNMLDASTISAICFTIFGVCCTMGTIGLVLYRRRFLNKPQALSEPDSSVYIDDSTMRDNSDEMYSLDNDSFLNSLEAMTIQNYWTDTVKHTKL